MYVCICLHGMRTARILACAMMSTAKQCGSLLLNFILTAQNAPSTCWLAMWLVRTGEVCHSQVGRQPSSVAVFLVRQYSQQPEPRQATLPSTSSNKLNIYSSSSSSTSLAQTHTHTYPAAVTIQGMALVYSFYRTK